jgi:hypothetical protein
MFFKKNRLFLDLKQAISIFAAILVFFHSDGKEEYGRWLPRSVPEE